MTTVAGKAKLTSISTSEALGSVISVPGRSISTTTSTTYSGNILAQYNANDVDENLGTYVSKVFEGPLALVTQGDSEGPRLLRDYHNALSYLEFDSVREDFLTSEGIVDARHSSDSSISITVLALVRIRPFPLNDQFRSPVSIGTLFRLGTASADLFLNEDKVELQLTTGHGTSRYRTEASVGEWKVYSFTFGPNPNEIAYFDLEPQTPYLVSGSSLEIDTVGKVQLGYHNRKGRLDADLGDMLILKKKPYQFELRQIASVIEGKFRSSSSLQSLSDVEVTGRAIRTGVVSSSSLSSSTAIPTADPGDLPDVISWHTATNPSDEEFEDCDRVPTWKGIAAMSDTNRVLASHVDPELRPKYREDFYKGGPAIQYPKDGIGSTAPQVSLLEKKEYTIFLAGKMRDNCRIFTIEDNGLEIRLKTSKTDWSKNNLVITTNRCTSQHRTAIFYEVFDRADAFVIILRCQNIAGEFTLEAVINGITLAPNEVTDFDSYKILQGEDGVDTDFGVPPEDVERTFEIQKDGPVQIGEGKDSSYFQVAWYSRPLIKDPTQGLDEVWFIRQWLANRYSE